MLFYSFEFFCLFFPICLVIYFLLGKKHIRLGIGWLVCCSVFFYGWWNPKYVPFLLLSVLFNYYFGLFLGNRRNRLLLLTGVAVNLGLIGYYKYAGFLATTFNQLSGFSLSIGQIILPLGISFFTFQQIAWLVDSHKGMHDGQKKGLLEYCLFVTFFPQLIAGPIVHHAEMMPQFLQQGSNRVCWDNMAMGITTFIVGLFKKVVIADSLAPYCNVVFDSSGQTSSVITACDAWLGSLGYTLQLYFDFSGYADMAVGLGLMCNIRLPVNFDSPYKSLNIAEFWRRWHITLSRFLRDYVYIPFGGSRKGELRRYSNLLLTMLIGGLWHGAGWTFIFWGGLHGMYLVCHRLWNRKSPWRLPGPLAHLLTFVCVTVAWVFFRAENFDSALNIVWAMMDIETLLVASLYSQSEVSAMAAVLLPALFIVFFLPNTQDLLGTEKGGIKIYDNKNRGWKLRFPYKPGLLWLSLVVACSLSSVYILLDQTKVQEFIYFQF